MARNPPEKKFEPEDPLLLTGVCLPGDRSGEMAECLVEEFLRMGYSELEAFYFFKSPQYAATHRVFRERGEAYVRDLIARVIKETPATHGGGF